MSKTSARYIIDVFVKKRRLLIRALTSDQNSDIIHVKETEADKAFKQMLEYKPKDPKERLILINFAIDEISELCEPDGHAKDLLDLMYRTLLSEPVFAEIKL